MHVIDVDARHGRGPFRVNARDFGSGFRVRERLAGLRRVWELWRRVARSVIIVARHVGAYLIALSHVVPLWTRSRSRRAASARGRAIAARHTRVAIEELGPTAIKLGQIVSTRNDV